MAAELEITALQESELPEVRQFLLSVFHLPADHRPFRLDALRWKAFDPHPWHSGSRSLVVRRGEQIVAHGIFSPLRFRSAAEAAVHCLMDWAADPTVPGIGVSIYQHLAKLGEVQIAIGGSDDARRMLPLMGFKPKQQLRSYRLITNAWKFHSQSAQRDWKTPARVARDWARGRKIRLSGAGGLEPKRVERFEDAGAVPMPDPRIAGCTVSARTPAVLDYALRCPIAAMEGWLLMRSAEAVGYFVLARVGAECRIAELWIHSESAEDWNYAATIASETAAQHRDTGAVFTTISTPVLQSALEQIGYGFVVEVPVALKDRQRRVPQDQPIMLSMLENDAFYLA